jgi:predicted amidohydrolase
LLAITDLKPDAIGVACAQLAPVFGDLPGNRERAGETIRAAARSGAGLIVLPELCTTGYAFADESQARELGEPPDGPTVTQWAALAAELGIVIVAGFCELGPGGAAANSAAVLDPTGVRRIYRKSHLWDREQLIFRPGTEPAPVIETALGHIGVAICYDAFFPETMRSLALAGADVIAVPMNSPVTEPATGPLAIEVVLALSAAHVNHVFVAQADRTGQERGIDWAQASVICDPGGHVLAGPIDGPGTVMAACDLTAARDKSLGPRNDVLADRRTELYTAGATSNAKETVN